MKVAKASVITAVVLLLIVAVMTGTGVGAANNRADPLATVYALQTRVAGDRDAPSTPAEPTRVPSEREEEPLPLGAGLQVDYYYFASDDYGNSHLLGEITNVGEFAVANPYVQFVLYDEAGNVVDAVRLGSVIPVIEPGESAPIEGSISDLLPEEWSTEEVTLCETYDEPSAFASDGLEVRDVEEIRKEQDALEIEGQVYNGGPAPVDGVTVIALAYNEDGRYAGSGRAPLQFEIPAERSGRFDLTAYGMDLAGVENDDYTYELWVGITPFATVSRC